jgi:hypothetical protein
MVFNLLNVVRHPITDLQYITECRSILDCDGALLLPGFVTDDVIDQVVEQSAPREPDAFYSGSTHNVYLTKSNPALSIERAFNRQILSSKGLIADDQIPGNSPLRSIYSDRGVVEFLCGVLDIERIYPYADELSSISVHYAAEGMELGWHFDNSSFAVTMLLQAPEGGGRFEYVPAVRDSGGGDMAYERVGAVLDGLVEPKTLEFHPGDLVLFRGRDALHRVTPIEGSTTRMLVVFAYNDGAGVALSDSALHTFYGRTA